MLRDHTGPSRLNSAQAVLSHTTMPVLEFAADRVAQNHSIARWFL